MTDLNPNVMTELCENDEILIERLVDDELSEQERQDLLLRLDETLDGWRFCALSFLEAQALRDALKSQKSHIAPPLATNINALAHDASIVKEQVGARHDKKKRDAASLKRIKTLAAIAAGIMLGAVCVARFQPHDVKPADSQLALQENVNVDSDVQYAVGHEAFTNADSHELAANQVYLSAPPEQMEDMSAEPSVNAPMLSRPINDDWVMADLALNAEPQNAGTFAAKVAPTPTLPREKKLSPVKTVTLNNPQLGLTNVSIPCYESNDLMASQLRQVADALPQENWEQLKNVQGQVNARRELYAFPMEDGRTLILPIDAYDVQADPNAQIW